MRKTWVVMLQSQMLAKLTPLGPEGNMWGCNLAVLTMAKSQESCHIVAAVFYSHSSAAVPCVVPTNALLLIFL